MAGNVVVEHGTEKYRIRDIVHDTTGCKQIPEGVHKEKKIGEV